MVNTAFWLGVARERTNFNNIELIKVFFMIGILCKTLPMYGIVQEIENSHGGVGYTGDLCPASFEVLSFDRLRSVARVCVLANGSVTLL